MVFGGGQSLGFNCRRDHHLRSGVRRGVEDAKREFASGLDEIGSQVSGVWLEHDQPSAAQWSR